MKINIKFALLVVILIQLIVVGVTLVERGIGIETIPFFYEFFAEGK